MNAESSVETAGAANRSRRRATAEPHPYAEAIECLQETKVPFALLRDDPDALENAKDVDLLLDESELHIAFAALQRAGFVQKKNSRLQRKWVFVRYQSGRFYVLDVHGAFVQQGIVYMDANLALSRLDHDGSVPRLSKEDLFLHLLLHNLLGKPQLQAKHASILRELHRGKLDRMRCMQQAAPFGLESLVEDALANLHSLTKDPKRWSLLRKPARRALMRYPGNRAAHWRYRKAGIFRKRARPVIVALLGPDGTGKTSLCNALESLLADGALSASRVYMGSWGHDHLPIRLIRRLVPPRISHARIYAARRGRPVRLTALERRHLEQETAGTFRLALRAARYAVKNAVFYGGIAIELWYRYARFIKRSWRPIVITDRYVYDLEFRQGREPFTHGAKARRWVYRLFPVPDGIIYLSVPYATVAARKPQLDREQFEVMDHKYRKMLKPHRPLELVTDVPCEELAATFMERFWEDLLHSCNKRA